SMFSIHILLIFSYFFYCFGVLRNLHPFPTRRSSDLTEPDMRAIPTRIHGVLDYSFGLLAAAAPWLFGFAAGGAETWVLVGAGARSEEHTSELQSRENLVCRLLLEKKKKLNV